ncbi:MAG: hypothetical protein K8F59_10940 [Rhodobacteraceae bacterium]|nr:hypothetical protein [Paracoccaceae bacterium]
MPHFQDVEGASPAGFGDSIARVDDKSPNAMDAKQASVASRPLLGRAPIGASATGQIDQGSGLPFLRFDLTDDKLSHSFSAGFSGDVMLFGRSGSWMAHGVSITSGGVLEIGPNGVTGALQDILNALGDIVGWVAVDRSISPAEQADLVNYYRARGAKGLLVAGPELLTNGDFSAGVSGWNLGPGWSVGGGVATHVPPSGSDIVQFGCLAPNTSYLITINIAAVRVASFQYVKTGSPGYNIVKSGMTVGNHTVAVRTGANPVPDLTLRAGGPSDVDFNSVSLRELRPQEDW